MIVKATLNENNFNNLNMYHFKAQSGRHGQGKDRHGACGEDYIIQVSMCGCYCEIVCFAVLLLGKKHSVSTLKRD